MQKTAEANPKYTGCSDMRKLIRPGDAVALNSIAACRNATELCRASGTTVVATGKALEVYRNFVVIGLRHGVRECANRGNIVKVKHLNMKGE